MFFLTTEDVIIATPKYLAKSDRTIDMSSEELAQDYQTQIKAGMATAVFIKPDVLWAEPLPASERREYMARYFAAFKSCKKESENAYRYISENGMLSILFLKSC